MSDPIGPVSPSILLTPPVWNSAVSAALTAELVRVRMLCSTVQSHLRAANASATVEWRGPARTDFDGRSARLLAALLDLDNLLTTCVAHLKAHDAAVAQTRQALHIVPCATSLTPTCSVTTGAHP